MARLRRVDGLGMGKEAISDNIWDEIIAGFVAWIVSALQLTIPWFSFPIIGGILSRVTTVVLTAVITLFAQFLGFDTASALVTGYESIFDPAKAAFAGVMSTGGVSDAALEKARQDFRGCINQIIVLRKLSLNARM